MIGTQAYHDVLPEEMSKRLSNFETPTSLYIRTMPDLLVMHIDRGTTFLVDLKTHDNKEKHDMCLEALPICHHIAKNDFNVKTFYAYRDEYKKYEKGFWLHDLNKIPIRIIMIPDRWDKKWNDWFGAIFSEWLPGVRCVATGSTKNGSNDPFIIIDESEVVKMNHWKEELEIANGTR